MTDKAIVICALLTALAITAIVFVRRAMRYRKALGAAVPEKEVIPEAETPPEANTQPESPQKSQEQSASNVYLNRFVFPQHRSSKGGKSVHITADHHARIKWILDDINRYGISMSRYLDGVLKAHFEDNAEVIEQLFGKMPDEIVNGKR